MLVHNAPAGQSPGRRALEPEQGGGWCLWLRDDAVRRFDAVVVAVRRDWCPKLPAYPGVFAGHTSHSHHHRAAEPFAGGRVLVVGGGSSAAEIAVGRRLIWAPATHESGRG
jgi:cation diffusion facilitator CzcD-associated flavoprotein CzcO